MAENINDYAEIYRNYHPQLPEYYNFGFDVIDKWAEDATRHAIHWVDEDHSEAIITYAQLSARSNQFANALHQLGLRKGDRVLILLPRVPAWWECLIGMIKCGVVALPATTQLTAKDIGYRVETADVRAVITDHENIEKFAALRANAGNVEHFIVVNGASAGWHNYDELINNASAQLDEKIFPRTRSNDAMLLYFTSGTTGYPKMVLHTQSSYPIGHQVTGRYWLDLKPSDLHWNLSDTGWAKAAWSNLFGPLNTGTTLFIHNGKGKFAPELTLELLSRYAITSFCAPPTAYRLLINCELSKYNLTNLRSVVSAGEPLNPEIIESWQAQTGMTIREGYGQTETCVLIANFPGLNVKPGSMGKPSPGYVVDIIDAQGAPAPAHQEGDIGVRIQPDRPIGLFQEYWLDADATRNAMRGDWYITGDRGFKDDDGYFWFIGRADDVIISAGYRIGPFEVESALIEHPAVLEAAVIGKPDATRGQIVKAFVILNKDFLASAALVTELQDFVKSTTAPYKYPREIEFVSELPKTISGKIRRVELRQRELKS